MLKSLKQHRYVEAHRLMQRCSPGVTGLEAWKKHKSEISHCWTHKGIFYFILYWSTLKDEALKSTFMRTLRLDCW